MVLVAGRDVVGDLAQHDEQLLVLQIDCFLADCEACAPLKHVAFLFTDGAGVAPALSY
ncbi:hypothetical protein D3C85_1775840 [compost metagenome]